MFFLSVLMMSVLGLVACGEETKSQSWWIEHPKEATDKYIDCKLTGEESMNCTNINEISGRLAEKDPRMMKIIEMEADHIKFDKPLDYKQFQK
ncbi:EexN family lipoprotein [Arsenophonus nasoniae]|nr:EexN family lipoprotein [Arsenophonus nasoniae]